jgi:hypothetical protein
LLGVLAGTLASFFGFGDNDDDQPAAVVPTDASQPVTQEPAVEAMAPGPSPEPSLTVSDSVDVAALRARLADLDSAVAALRSQLQ